MLFSWLGLLSWLERAMGVWGRFWRMECSWAVSVGTATVQRGSEAAHTAFNRLISRSQQGGTRARVQWQLAVVLVGPNGTDARRAHSVETASPERATHVALCLDDQVFRLLECLANQGFGTRRPQRDRCSPCGGRERPSSLWCALKGACCCSQGACCWMGSHVRFV